MLKSANISHALKERMLFRIVISVFIVALLSTPGLMSNGKVLANAAGHDISCGGDTICNSIEGNEFDLILFSSAGSEMVILYNESTIGRIVPNVSESYYSKAKGTVKDVIYYLSRHTEYSGFKFKKARKSTGLFRSEVLDGVYVALPEYASMSDNRPPEYSFSDKDGTLTVRIKAVVEMSGN